MGDKENKEFLQLVEKVKFKRLDMKYGYLNETFEKIFKLLPHVDRQLVQQASAYCTLGFDPNRDYDVILWKTGDDASKQLELRMERLLKQVKLCKELDLFPGIGDDSICYQYFNNDFCERIFGVITEGQKFELRKTFVPYPALLYGVGSTLIDLDDAEEAEEVLHEAVSWNMTDAAILFEYAESLKIKGDFDGFLEETKCAWAVSYTAESVARVFRNFAFYFSEKEEWQKAYACLAISGSYDDNQEKISQELQYIQDNSDVELEELSVEMIDSCLDDIPTGANPEIIDLLGDYCQELYDAYENAKCLEYMQHLYDLTDDKDVQKKIKELKSGRHKKER